VSTVEKVPIMYAMRKLPLQMTKMATVRSVVVLGTCRCSTDLVEKYGRQA
jgi:hypothetical protein